MHPAPHYADQDPAFARRLIREHPWVTIVSLTTADDGTIQPVVSQYPALLDDAPGANEGDDVSIVSHMSRPDADLHQLGSGLPCTVIVTGEHGYISPAWYLGNDALERIPTWNVETVMLHGTSERLSDDENFAQLTRLVDHFEAPMPDPIDLREVGHAAGVARGTAGLRLRATRWQGKAKLSQQESDATRASVMNALESDGPYVHPALARVMRRRFADDGVPRDPQSFGAEGR